MTRLDPDEIRPPHDAVYTQLRAQARERMSAERDGHTLQATALVHECVSAARLRADAALEDTRCARTRDRKRGTHE